MSEGELGNREPQIGRQGFEESDDVLDDGGEG